MAKDKISMPSSMGGLTRYFDEYKSKISFKPAHVILLAIVIILLEILIHSQGKQFLGLP